MPLAERWDGTRWTILKTILKINIIGGELDGVSCTSATACTAVGTRPTGTGLAGSPIAIRSS